MTLLQSLLHSNLYPIIAVRVALVLVLLYLAWRWLCLLWVSLSSDEPPALRSKIPIFGHLLGLIQYGPLHLPVLGEGGLSIASLPMMNGAKLYAVWDPAIVQSLQKSKTISFFPFLRHFTKRQTEYRSEFDGVMQQDNGVLEQNRKVVQNAMTLGHVSKMNFTALEYLASQLQQLTAEGPQDVENVWIWFRNTMTAATCEAMFGKRNPLTNTEAHPTVMEDVWTFEAGVDRLVMIPFPWLTCKDVVAARSRLQNAMRDYYVNNYDQRDDTSQLIRSRAELLRAFALTNEDIGDYEISIMHVAITNTISTGFWFLAYIYGTPGLAEALRIEAEAAVQPGQNADNEADVDVATVDIAHVVDKCPLLIACYKETLRLTNQFIGNRLVQTDTVVTDGCNRKFQLKAGTSIQWPARSLHLSEAAWGPDVNEFRPERFLDIMKDPESPDSKAKTASYIPFGGGRHYCPGRNFAQAENVGIMVMLLLGYEVSSLVGPSESIGIPGTASPSFASAVLKPFNAGNGYGLRISRRKQWEDTRWRFIT